MPNLPAITLGTMRLADKNLSFYECYELFNAAILNGVNGFHFSSEYDSFELVSSSLKKIVANKSSLDIKVIAKLASPHFNEECFDHVNLENKIDNILQKTGLERIELAQWMWRQAPLNDDSRISNLSSQANEIINYFDDIIAKGKVKRFGCFPYTGNFMEKVSSLKISDIHINYLNFWEDSLLESEILSSSIALRPFFAGKIKEVNSKFIEELNTIQSGNGIFHSLKYVLSHPNICSAVLGLNSIKQLDEVVNISDSISKNIETFNQYRSIITNNKHLL